MNKPIPIPLSVKVSRLRVARSHIAERHARLNYFALRARYDAGEQVASTLIGFVTMTLWAAEAVHRESSERFRETLRLREVPPAGERWSRVDLDAWVKRALANTSLPEQSTPP